MNKKSRFVPALLISAVAVLANTVVVSCTPTKITAAGRLTPTPSSPRPQPGEAAPVIVSSIEPTPVNSRDLAPSMPMKDKEMLIVRYANGTKERIYLRSEDVEAFVKGLDRGIAIEYSIPPESTEWHEPPQPPSVIPTSDNLPTVPASMINATPPPLPHNS